jgi:hypothetical protein
MRLTIRAAMTSILFLSAFLAADGAGAQFLKYTPPGGPEEEPESRQERMERELEEARWRVGVVRVAPWAALRDVAYVRNDFATGAVPPNDWTATAGLGFRAYLRNGPKATWRAQVLPEYSWWQKQDERRRLNGRYSLGFHGFFNRLTLEVQAGREQEQRIVTPEVPVLASSRIDGAEVLAELELTGALFAFAAASVNQQESLVDDLDDPRSESLALLDREERVTRLGLRWRPREQWSIGVGAERSQAEFEDDALDRSNSGTAPLAEIRFDGRRLRFQAAAAKRSLEARSGAAFVPYDEVTGNAALSIGTPRRLSATLYGSRGLVYALSSTYAYLDDERLGVALTVGVGRRLTSRFFAETGTNDYTAFDPAAPPRSDDVSSYGAGLSFSLPWNVTFGVQALRSEYDSDLPGGDRSYGTLGTTVTLGGR